MIAAIIKEGRKLTRADVELLTLDSEARINAAIDSVLLPESTRAVGDTAYIRAFGRYLFIAREQRRENFPQLNHDEAESWAIQQVHSMLLKYTKMTGPRTVAGFNGHAKKVARRALFNLDRKINSYREDGEYTDETRGVRRVLAGSETTNDIDAFDLAEAFTVFYEKLTPDDQRILQPLYSVAGEPWAYYTPNVRDDVANIELKDRLNALSDRCCAHPADVRIRRDSLYTLFQRFLEFGNEAFRNYEHGPKWGRGSCLTVVDEQGPAIEHAGVNGVRNQSDRGNPIRACDGPRLERKRKRDHKAWLVPDHSTRNARNAVKA